MIRTLIIHTGGIGDFLLTCPAIAHLSQDGPVTLLGNRERLELAVASGLATAAHSLDRADFSSVFSEPSAVLRSFLRPFDRAVVWMRDTGEIANAFRAGGIEDVRCFPGLPPDDWTRHASEYYLDCLGAPPAPSFRLHLPPANTRLDTVIHPGSGAARKNWPITRFIELANLLEQQGHRVTWCTGPAEEELALPAGVSKLRCDSLVELGAQLATAALYVGNDSGITHLAAAVGCPTVAIFGPTDPSLWAPRGEHVWVARMV